MTRFPHGVPCWIDVATPAIDGAAAFYGRLFGWEIEQESPDDPYRVARLEGREVAGMRSQAEGAAVWNTYVRVDSAEEAAARATANGGVVFGVLDVEGGRMAACVDPAGAPFCLWEPRGREGAGLVNAAGTWNWSNLTTSDPDAAAAFYGAVFGWEAAPVGEVWMWRRPGYAEVLEARDPDLRRRHAEAGAPAGFSDAIGWLAPLTGHDAPRWDVTFAIGDADAITAAAAELGGTVIVAPFDAGPARMAVLRDPQGAAFTVSRYAP